jgi:hypothetical protein
MFNSPLVLKNYKSDHGGHGGHGEHPISIPGSTFVDLAFRRARRVRRG